LNNTRQKVDLIRQASNPPLYVSKLYPIVNLKAVFLNTRCTRSLFPYKDRLNRLQRSEVVYKASYWDCDEVKIGKTKRRLQDRNFKALAKQEHAPAIADPIKPTGHDIKWADHFEIIASRKTDYHCKIKETLFIQELNPNPQY